MTGHGPLHEPAGAGGYRALLDDMNRQGAALRSLTTDRAFEGALSLLATAVVSRWSVVFSGVGASLHAADVIAARFRSHGLAAWTINAADLVHHVPELHRAPLVLISQSGESVEVVKAARVHAGRSPTWCLTLNPKATLSDVSMLVMPGGGERGYAATRSFTTTLAVGEMLQAACALEVGNTTDAPAVDLVAAASDVEQAGPELEAGIRSVVGRLSAAATLLFTGRGALAGIAQYGALITMELARRPAFALESAMVRHGPIEAFGPDLALVALRRPDGVESLVTGLVALARDHGSPTALVHAGRPPEAQPPHPPDVVAPARSSFGALLVHCVAMQHLAIALTEARGLVPGEATRGTKVTRVE